MSFKLSGAWTQQTSNYQILSTDYIISFGQLSTAVTATLPASPAVGDTYFVVDGYGGASTHNIIISGNGHNVNGSGTFTINTNHAYYEVTYNSSSTGWLAHAVTIAPGDIPLIGDSTGTTIA